MNKNIIEEFSEQLENYIEKIENATTIISESQSEPQDVEENLVVGKMDRRQLKEVICFLKFFNKTLIKVSLQKLLEMSKKSKLMNEYEKVRLELVEYLKKTFEQYLQEPSSRPFHEIFFFNDMSIKKQIIGSHRAAIHAALNDPQYYLQV